MSPTTRSRGCSLPEYAVREEPMGNGFGQLGRDPGSACVHAAKLARVPEFAEQVFEAL